MSKHIHEMRAYGKVVGDETSYDVVGYIILDEDMDEPVTDIYTDKRMPVCGSNWSLYETQHVPNCNIPRNTYFHGDWFGKGVIDLGIPCN